MRARAVSPLGNLGGGSDRWALPCGPNTVVGRSLGAQEVAPGLTPWGFVLLGLRQSCPQLPSMKLTRLILTDSHFLLPLAVLLLGVALLAALH